MAARKSRKPGPRNALYAQSGGVTAVINATACGVIEACRKHRNRIGRLYAGRDGIVGALTEDLIDTSLESAATIRALRHTPSGAFGSARYKLKDLERDRAKYERLIAVGLVFQEYALFPHMTVLGNVLAAMDHRARHEREPRARELLSLVHLESLASRRPTELSGGQRQRVAVARALARDPSALLLDEPFAAVDRAVRSALYGELETLRHSVRVPILLVTHDFEEVARLADRLVVIEHGRLVAQGPVTELTSRTDIPQLTTQYDPGSLFDANIEAHDAERKLTRLSFEGGALWAPLIAAQEGARLRIRIAAREVSLARRAPEEISLHNVLPGLITAIAPASDPALVIVTLRIGTATLLAQITCDAISRLGLRSGTHVFALIKSVALLRPGGG